MIRSALFSGILRNLECTKSLADYLASLLCKGDTLLLQGPMGIGKTTLARFLIQRLMKQEVRVVSPTFTLIQSYSTTKGPLCHIDLYRLNNLDSIEFDLLGLWHSNITLLEWPERLGTLRPPQNLLLEMASDRSSKNRYVTLYGSSYWTKRLQKQPPWTASV